MSCFNPYKNPFFVMLFIGWYKLIAIKRIVLLRMVLFFYALYFQFKTKHLSYFTFKHNFIFECLLKKIKVKGEYTHPFTRNKYTF